MKKLMLTLALAVLVGSVAFASTNVTSVNVVGFIRTTVPAGGWSLISLPFNRLDQEVSVTVPEILPSAPVGVKAWFYRDGVWQAETRQTVVQPPNPPTVQWVPGTNEFIRGDALFVNAPSAAGDVELTVMGEVPDSRTAPTTTVFMAQGWTLVGFAYPADVALTNTTLNTEASVGDKIWWWDQSLGGGQGGWANATRQTVVAPPNPPTVKWVPEDTVLGAGLGYFYSRIGIDFDWEQVKPYTQP